MLATPSPEYPILIRNAAPPQILQLYKEQDQLTNNSSMCAEQDSISLCFFISFFFYFLFPFLVHIFSFQFFLINYFFLQIFLSFKFPFLFLSIPLFPFLLNLYFSFSVSTWRLGKGSFIPKFYSAVSTVSRDYYPSSLEVDRGCGILVIHSSSGIRQLDGVKEKVGNVSGRFPHS